MLYRVVFLLFFIFSSINLYSQVDIRIYRISSNDVFRSVRDSGGINESKLKKNIFNKYIIRLKRPHDMTKDVDEDNYKAEDNSQFYVEIYNKSEKRISLEESGISNIVIERDNGSFLHEIEVKNGMKNENKLIFSLNEIADKVEEKDEIHIKVYKEKTVLDEFLVYYLNPWVFYNSTNSIPGFWFPVNMYTVDFEVNKGALFSAAPISIAFGGKIHWGSGMNYIGISAFITSGESFNEEDQLSYLENASIGGMFDFLGIFNIGFGYNIDFRKSEKKLIPQFVLGLNYDILNSK